MQRRDLQDYTNQESPETYPIFEAFFSKDNIKFINDEITYKMKMAGAGDNFQVHPGDVKNAMYEFYYYAFNHPAIMTQEVINVLVKRFIQDKETQDTAHLNPWIQQFDGTFGIQEIPFIKLDHRRAKETLEFSVQRWENEARG